MNEEAAKNGFIAYFTILDVVSDVMLPCLTRTVRCAAPTRVASPRVIGAPVQSCALSVATSNASKTNINIVFMFKKIFELRRKLKPSKK